MNKRGTIQDLLYIGIVLTVFAVMTLIVFKVASEINTNFQENTEITDEGKNAFGTITNMYPGVINNMALIFMIGLSVVALFLASMVRVHPVFFVFYFIILIIMIFIAGIMSNIYLEIANTAELVGQADQLNFITRIMWILPFFIGVLGTVLAVIMYSKWKQDAG